MPDRASHTICVVVWPTTLSGYFHLLSASPRLLFSLNSTYIVLGLSPAHIPFSSWAPSTSSAVFTRVLTETRDSQPALHLNYEAAAILSLHPIVYTLSSTLILRLSPATRFQLDHYGGDWNP